MKNIIFMICLTAILSACGDSSEPNTSSTDSIKKDTTAETQVDQFENKSKEEPIKIKEVPKLTLGEVLVLDDFAEITVTNNTFGKVINPPNPSNFYTYYENKEIDEIYLDTVIVVKSLFTSQKSAEEFVNVKILYDNKYEYQAFSTIEEDGGSDFTYTSITSIEPLKNGTLHFLASLPALIENDGKPLKALITIKGETYEQIIR